MVTEIKPFDLILSVFLPNIARPTSKNITDILVEMVLCIYLRY